MSDARTARADTIRGLSIPQEMLPGDGRFGSGPSRIRDAQMEALSSVSRTVMGTSHRQAPVKQYVGRIRAGLRELFSLPEGYEVVLGNGGSTAFWGIAACGLVEQRAQNLVLGEFSQKFAAELTAAPHLRGARSHRRDARRAPGACRPGGRRCLRLAAQRDLDRV